MVEKSSSRELKDCPFRAGNCIASDCMIWIDTFDLAQNEAIGHCATVKAHQSLITMETILTIFLIVFLIALVMTLGPALLTMLFIQLNL